MPLDRRAVCAFCDYYAAWAAFVLLLLLVRHAPTVDASLSGFYVDNGRDQTVMHRMLTANDAEHVEHEILDLLGLPDRPSGRRLRHPSMRKSAPKFLLDVYRRLAEQEGGGATLADGGGGGGGRHARSAGTDDNLITDRDREAIDQSDVIMTFLSKSEYYSDISIKHT